MDFTGSNSLRNKLKFSEGKPVLMKEKSFPKQKKETNKMKECLFDLLLKSEHVDFLPLVGE